MEDESPCRRCVAGTRSLDRRTFLGAGTLAAVSFALAACTDPLAPDPGPPIGHSITVADYPAITNVGGILIVSLDGAPIAIVRTGDTAFIALSRVCPHRGAYVNETATGFRCPRHGATFDSYGRWTGGQSTTDLRSRSTHYDITTDTLTVD